MTSKKSVYFVSLGCPKNRVDSETMLGHLVGDGYQPVTSAEEADIIVVNTCGFIDAAKEESIDAILEMARYKHEGRAESLVVTGCLSQRYAAELHKEIPEVDHFLGTGNFEEIAQVLRAAEGRAATSSVAGPVANDRELASVMAGTGVSVGAAGASTGAIVGHKRLPILAALVSNATAPVIPDPDFTLTAASPRVATLPGTLPT